MISIHHSTEIERLCRNHAMDPYWGRRYQSLTLRRGLGPATALQELPSDVANLFMEQVSGHVLSTPSIKQSLCDGATKLVLSTAAGLQLETVLLRPGTGRTSVCISSQVGCAAKCSFCATGQMGIAKNLSRDEILDQVVWANEILASENRRVRNVVFMGMGEPLHNEEAVFDAVERLVARDGFSLAPRRVTVSTVGIVPSMIRLAETFPQVGIALSLHTAREEARQQIVPLTERFPVNDLRAAVSQINAIQNRPVMLECLMLKGITDTEADVQALLAFAQGLRVHVNLIPLNPVDSPTQLCGSEPARIGQIAEQLKQVGLHVTVRYSLGQDIAAACGQLARPQKQRSNAYAAGTSTF